MNASDISENIEASPNSGYINVSPNIFAKKEGSLGNVRILSEMPGGNGSLLIPACELLMLGQVLVRLGENYNLQQKEQTRIVDEEAKRLLAAQSKKSKVKDEFNEPGTGR